jgi:hypothetical protein
MHTSNFVASIDAITRELEEDEATTITITLAPGMYERIQRYLIDNCADESVETYITDALDDVLTQFIDEPF